MSDFYSSARYKQSMTASPMHDEILRDVLSVRSVRRKEDMKSKSAYDQALVLDRAWGMDAVIKLDNGMTMTLSEKCLSYEQSAYNSLTIEHMQSDSELGDWYHVRADLYMVSYLDSSGEGLEKWCLVDLPALKIASARDLIRWRSNANGRDGARASFKFVDVRDLARVAPHCIIAQSGMLDLPAEDGVLTQ